MLAVIAYHVSSLLPAGFLGVDVFFVLSGYLITALLLQERLSRGRIRFAEFWARRARRLLPAALLLLLVTAVVTAYDAPVSTFDARRSDIVATLLYAANWHFIATDQSYFATFAGVSPLRHMWSLAIEEQFYLAWPLIAAAVFAAPAVRRDPARLAGWVLVAALASAVLMAVLYDPANPSRAYFGTDARAHALLVGLRARAARRGPARDPRQPGGRRPGAQGVAGRRRVAGSRAADVQRPGRVLLPRRVAAVRARRRRAAVDRRGGAALRPGRAAVEPLRCAGPA